jgi:hypothetical protein
MLHTQSRLGLQAYGLYVLEVVAVEVVLQQEQYQIVVAVVALVSQ